MTLSIPSFYLCGKIREMSKITKISRYFSLVESDNGGPQAIFHHRTHTLYFNLDQWDLKDIDYGDLPVNVYNALDIDQFYDLLEKIDRKTLGQ